MTDPSPRERLLLATLEAIESHGAEHVTVREITERAGVNVAAVSYYFGGKEALIAQALEGTLRETFDHPLRDFDLAVARGVPPGAALVTLLAEQLRGARAWPGLARAHLFQLPGGDITERAAAFLDALAERLAPARAGSNAADDRLALALLWSTVVFGGVAPRFVDGVARLDLTQPRHRDRWVKALVRAHFSGLSIER